MGAIGRARLRRVGGVTVEGNAPEASDGGQFSRARESLEGGFRARRARESRLSRLWKGDREG